MEFRKVVTITLYVREQKRHRCVEQSFDWCPMLHIDFLSSVYVLKLIFDLFYLFQGPGEGGERPCWFMGRISTVFSSVQFISVAQSCPTLCDPMNRSMPGLPVHHQLPEFTQTHVHRVSDAIQPSHPPSSPSPPAPNPSQHQSLFQ